MKPTPGADTALDQAKLLTLAQSGNGDAFEVLVAPYRGELIAHCYRMLGSLQDAEDAIQEALVNAWRGLDAFEGRSSLRTWLYRVTTNACLRFAERRPPRILALDRFPSTTDPHLLGDFRSDIPWLEPIPERLVAAATPIDTPERQLEIRESVELAFIASLQHLPATQRAVLILREVLAFPATEVAAQLEMSVPAVNSALQRARATMEQRQGGVASQHATLRDLGDRRQRELVQAFVHAWDHADIPGILALLTEDVRFAMPPLACWFDGREAVARFLRERMFDTPWRFVPTTVNGQLAFAAYQQQVTDTGFPLAAINVVNVRGDRFSQIVGFLDRNQFAAFELPPESPLPPLFPPRRS